MHVDLLSTARELFELGHHVLCTFCHEWLELHQGAHRVQAGNFPPVFGMSLWVAVGEHVVCLTIYAAAGIVPWCLERIE